MSKLQFAKLFDTKHGQILVKADEGENRGSEVRFYFQPEELAVSSSAFLFPEDETGEKARECLANVTEDMAIKMAEKFRALTVDILGGEASDTIN